VSQRLSNLKRSYTTAFSSCPLIVGHLIERIQLLNTALERFRRQRFMPIKKTSDWNISAPNQLHLLAEWKDSFYEELFNYSQITTIILPCMVTQSYTKWRGLLATPSIGVDLGGSRGTRPPIIELGGKGILLPPNNPGEHFWKYW